jgi:hypothetical protein
MAVSKERGEEVHVRGAANAAVTLEEYGDFQCPPCGGLEAPLQQIERDYASSLRVIFRNFPLPIMSMPTRLPMLPKRQVCRDASGKCTTCFIASRRSGPKPRMSSRCLIPTPG